MDAEAEFKKNVNDSLFYRNLLRIVGIGALATMSIITGVEVVVDGNINPATGILDVLVVGGDLGVILPMERDATGRHERAIKALAALDNREDS